MQMGKARSYNRRRCVEASAPDGATEQLVYEDEDPHATWLVLGSRRPGRPVQWSAVSVIKARSSFCN